MKKILVLSTFAYTLWNLRKDMLVEMVRRGYDVIAVAPEKEDVWARQFSGINVRYLSINLERTGLNPFQDLQTLISLRRLFHNEKPDILFAYQAKSIVYGCIAAKMTGVQHIYSLVAGLGSIFQPNGLKGSILRSILSFQYTIAFSFCQSVFFQNRDDVDEFVNKGLIKQDKTVIINGSGVNLESFMPQPMPKNPVFLFIGRILKDKGLMEYAEAARIVKKYCQQARFLIVGQMETNPMAIKEEELRPFIDEGIVEYFGFTENVKPYLRQCSVFVLPSYREGTPRATLEAMATGRPIITTDVPGCRETVLDGLNGFLIPAKNIPVLAEKMLWMIEHQDEAERMGYESLSICRKKYDVIKVNQVIMNTMQL